MEVLDAIILGIVQGATEFIPISSTGHLVVVREFLGLTSMSDLAFDAVLQLATALAVLVYFFGDVKRIFRTVLRIVSRETVSREDQSLVSALLLGTIPAIILGLFLEEYMETTFRNVSLVAWMLIAGSVLMALAERMFRGTGMLTSAKGFFIGLFQSLALFPGMSRSGSTISGGMLLGLSREAATRFSFLLSFPILFGSGAKKLLDLWSEGMLGSLGISLLAGSMAAFIVGLFAIRFLIEFLKTRTLTPFIIYRLALAVLILILL